MILEIFLAILFLILVTLLVFFIVNIFLPAVKGQLVKNSDYIFAPIEKKYIFRNVDGNVTTSDNRAVVLCQMQKEPKKLRMNYNGIKSCALFAETFGTLTEENQDCIGFGDCAAVCPQEAIQIVNGTAVVTKNCCGCGTCVLTCPKRLISLFPKEQKSVQYKNDVNNMHIIEIPEKKGFKFWQSWYTILGE